MKKTSVFKILAILITASMFVLSCTDEGTDVRLDPKLATTQVLNVTSDSATVLGFVVASGEGFTEKGVCYNTEPNPNTSHNKVVYTGDQSSAAFNVTLSGLHYTTKYYVRAYAIHESGTLYGEEFSFTTAAAKPVVTTTEVTEIQSSSAKSGGNVTDAGGAEIVQRGVCYGTEPNPDFEDHYTEDGEGSGEFESVLTGLLASTTYYVRAYATNSAGTSFGEQLTFTTLDPILPTVVTLPMTSVLGTSAVGGGEVTDDGGADVTARGVVYALTPNPTIADNKTEDGTGVGEFTSSISNLQGLTTYYLRAYATNSVGTAYGEELQFTTLTPILIWYVPGNYLEASYPGSTYENWNPANSPVVRSVEETPDQLEGYVYMANPNNEWKFTSQPDWNGTNYGYAGPGLLDTNPAAGNMNSPEGYYKLNADATALTYTAVATVWGVIGDASPMQWDDETPLYYDPPSQTWRGGVSMIPGGFKFRANHDWAYNYGADPGDPQLRPDGPNITIEVAADYYFVLDLSSPNDYTYSTDRWGLVGDATGSWDIDNYLSWDPDTRSLTITMDLAAGGVKFRANGGWAVNLGGPLDNLAQDGANIPIAEAGNYTIHLFLDHDRSHCTITKN